MLRRVQVIALSAVDALFVSQCVSPLDPDTPRTITPDPSENLHRPPVSDTLAVAFRMKGVLKRDWDPFQEILLWPLNETSPARDECEVKTSETPYAYSLYASYRRNVILDSLQIDINDVIIHSITFQLQSLELPMDSSAVEMNRNQFERGNSITFDVAYMARSGANLNDSDSLVTDGDTSRTNAIITHCTLGYNGYDNVEDTFNLILRAKFKLKSSTSEYDYEGRIALKHHP